MSATNPAAARILVYNVVVSWVGDAVGIPARRVSVSRTFKGSPTGGYGFNEGRFLQMCDEISVTISISSGRMLRLPGGWRVEHEDDVIAVFIDAVARKLLTSPISARGVRAREFARRQ